MPGLIPLIKKVRPNLPIIYRSHIEIRSDLVKVPGSPQEEVWKYLWNNIKMADTFLSELLSCKVHHKLTKSPQVIRSRTSFLKTSQPKFWHFKALRLIGLMDSTSLSTHGTLNTIWESSRVSVPRTGCTR